MQPIQRSSLISYSTLTNVPLEPTEKIHPSLLAYQLPPTSPATTHADFHALGQKQALLAPLARLQLHKPIVCLDIESPYPSDTTTPLAIEELAAIKVHPNGQQDILTYQRKPSNKHLPGQEASTTVRYDGPFQNIAHHLYEFLDNSDLVMYNAAFDLKLLQKAFEPLKLYFPDPKANIIDPWRIFCYYQPRDLAAAHQHYCQEKYNNRHTALADAQATLSVFAQQLAKHPNIPNQVDKISQFFRSPNQSPQFVDAQGKLQRNSQGEITLAFGKYRQQSLQSIYQSDPEYLHWILKNDFPSDMKRNIEETLKAKSIQHHTTLSP